MEGLPTLNDIDSEIRDGYFAVEDLLGVQSECIYASVVHRVIDHQADFPARYFRPPYGTVGARMRQRLAAFIDDPYIVNWSVDIEDWLWANSDHPERQLKAFRRDLARGGDIVVMHYLSWSTVQYFRDVIQMARETGKQIMRVDQCLMDPDAPPLEGETSDEESEAWGMQTQKETQTQDILRVGGSQ